MPRKKQFRTCEVCGKTSNEIRINFLPKENMYLCDKHKSQIRRFGKITNVKPGGNGKEKWKSNDIVIDGNIASLIIIKNSKEKIYVLIDTEDIPFITQYCWHINKNGYVSTIDCTTKKQFYLHRYILQYNGKLDIDHINHNPLDNRKQNLRIVDRTTNNLNKKVAGVGIQKQYNRYYAHIDRKGKRYYVGSFKTFEDAVEARKIKLQEIERSLNITTKTT